MNMDGLYQVLDRAKFKSLVSYEEISTDAFALVNNSQEKLSDIIKMVRYHVRRKTSIFQCDFHRMMGIFF